MTVQVDENWWKDLFDEVYLITDARSVCDDELTCREVDFLENALLQDKSAPVLDMCGGQGRHSLELSRRGFENVTVLDYSEYLIEMGKIRAEEEGLATEFVRCDARDTDLPGESFKFIIVMGSSFGYFENEGENSQILNESFRLLLPEGSLLLDLANKEYVLKNFTPTSEHLVNDDITVKRERMLGDDVIFSREIVTSEKYGCIRDQTYLTRLYSPEKISELMYSAGFASVTCEKDFMDRTGRGDYGSMTNRMVVTATKDNG
jgi:D-alanine-D-alanine ligase